MGNPLHKTAAGAAMVTHDGKGNSLHGGTAGAAGAAAGASAGTEAEEQVAETQVAKVGAAASGWHGMVATTRLSRQQPLQRRGDAASEK